MKSFSIYANVILQAQNDKAYADDLCRHIVANTGIITEVDGFNSIDGVMKKYGIGETRLEDDRLSVSTLREFKNFLRNRYLEDKKCYETACRDDLRY